MDVSLKSVVHLRLYKASAPFPWQAARVAPFEHFSEILLLKQTLHAKQFKKVVHGGDICLGESVKLKT